jgi:hypothetical protein
MTHQRTDFELMQWRAAKNTGDADIGPREVVEIVTGGDDLDRSILAVARPSDPIGNSLAVNGPTSIKAGKFGKVCCGPIVLVKYGGSAPEEVGGDSPDVDSLWSPDPDSGDLSWGHVGMFRCLRLVDTSTKIMLAQFPVDDGPWLYELQKAFDYGGNNPDIPPTVKGRPILVDKGDGSGGAKYKVINNEDHDDTLGLPTAYPEVASDGSVTGWLLLPIGIQGSRVWVNQNCDVVSGMIEERWVGKTTEDVYVGADDDNPNGYTHGSCQITGRTGDDVDVLFPTLSSSGEGILLANGTTVLIEWNEFLGYLVGYAAGC